MAPLAPPGIFLQTLTQLRKDVNETQEDRLRKEAQRQRTDAIRRASELAQQRLILQSSERTWPNDIVCGDYNCASHFATSSLGFTDDLARLTDDLQACLNESSRSAKDDEVVASCIRNLQDLMQKQHPAWQLMPFGSACNGFGTSNSDLDVSAYRTDFDCEACVQSGRGSARESLQQLLPLLQECTKFQIIDVVWSAKIPIAKLRFEDALDVDLSCHNLEPFQNTRLLRAYATSFPMVRDLGILIKLWAKSQKLCGAREGHLSSYTWTLMVIYFLQVDTSVKLPCFDRPLLDVIEKNQEAAKTCGRQHFERCGKPLSYLVEGFFHFFAHEFCWGSEVVSVRLGKRLNRDNPAFSALPGCSRPRFHVEDPFLLDRNLNCVLGDYQEEVMLNCLRVSTCSLQSGFTPYGLSPLTAGEKDAKETSPKEQLSLSSTLFPEDVDTMCRYECKRKKLKNAKIPKRAKSMDGAFQKDSAQDEMGPEARVAKDGAASSRAIAMRHYVAEAGGYLSVAQGEQIWALTKSPEEGDLHCAWPNYIYACRCCNHCSAGWVPFDILVWVENDAGVQ